MLYQIYEYQRAMMLAWADQSAQAFVNPFSPFAYIPGAKHFAAGWERLHCLSTGGDEPTFGIPDIVRDGCVVPVVEQIVWESPFCRLRRFEATTSARHGDVQRAVPAVLVCAPLAGHHAVMLREVVQSLLQEHIVYVTDWSNARHIPVADGSFHLDDYVTHVQEFIREIDVASLHVLAVCQATVPALGAIALLASRDERTPSSLTLIGGPIDARRSPTAIGRLASSHSIQWFRRNLVYTVPQPYAGAGRQVCPSFVQLSGLAAAQSAPLWDLYADYCATLARGDAELANSHWQALLDYSAVLDMAADFYLDTVRTVFQEFQMAFGSWQVRGQAVRPQDIRSTALLTIEGELDDISGRGQTHAAHDLCRGLSSRDKRLVTIPGCSHYDLFRGPTWRTKVFPSICDLTRHYAQPLGGRLRAKRAVRASTTFPCWNLTR
ncbi:polyhydroxyalkanoate depolymerase [Cupriavidus taiwanensis]|uniref:polyhydroxyalkanoate depolymerase n=1 Tax=Cupriavidus taiwanensis TaxID=164546 RepID=UPI000E1A57D6|nr:polyhydroxyalkanoate depolymerase [Cupriavidus taiwanensis]SOZ33766.1 PHB-depolymerase 5 [Cupriavidus taiwanensis]SPA38444.1 PHB-depolymerase 5 [Cupriavidus taiwanensis]